jgi:NADH:ubiquinone oxidoreductase subunit 2 (subunit N)
VQTLILLLPQLILFLAALVVFGLDLVGRDEKKWLPYVALGGTMVALVVTVYLMSPLAADLQSATAGPMLGGTIALDSFALFFQIVATLVAALVIISSLGYMRERTPYRAEFYGLLLIACLAITLVAAAADLMLVYVAFELLSITSYVLTGYLRDDRKSNEAAIKYFLYGAMASAAMLYGMSLLYGATASTELSAIAGALLGADASLRWLMFPAIVLLMVGFGFKIAAVALPPMVARCLRGSTDPGHRLPLGGTQGGRLCRAGAGISDRLARLPGRVGGPAVGHLHDDHDPGQPGGSQSAEHQAYAGLFQYRPRWLYSRWPGLVGPLAV